MTGPEEPPLPPVLDYRRSGVRCPPGRRRAVRIAAGLFAVPFGYLVIAVIAQPQTFGTVRDIVPVLAIAVIGVAYCGLVAGDVFHR